MKLTLAILNSNSGLAETGKREHLPTTTVYQFIIEATLSYTVVDEIKSYRSCAEVSYRGSLTNWDRA